ncbi:hypothetical protein EOK75_14275 (plasmid) [Pseudorhodobacter turbinis]|uniref:Phage gp6-like head-tail connector protein n=1 Tax=Pseudorhodobacter turbinis TaxID=2500533 RepID=A0A4P8EJE1_9RHOB|nr:phage head-tail connector protein [Pseudorhodobacter turbinis]QCO56962.1 hypothetical protein EOK75_14275 [Pseudorhodobacter turbinis]
MTYTRTPTTTETAITLEAAKLHCRVDGNEEDVPITGLIIAASNEIEAQADIALLSQTITTTTDQGPGNCIRLPVGPVAADAVATVELIEQDGTATPITSGYWLEGGRYPRLHFTTTPGGRLRITYPAGYGDTHEAIPADLAHGIADQVARMYDERGGVYDKAPALSPHTARVIARHRRVAL